MSHELAKIDPNDIIPLNSFSTKYPIFIHLVYAQPHHKDNHFPNLYDRNAEVLWAHKDIAAVALLAAKIANHAYGWTLAFTDCLRPVEAQEKMADYGYDESLVSTPGSGAHPRAMAIDIVPYAVDGRLVEMGTYFDHFAENPDNDNPAARNYTKFAANITPDNVLTITANRNALEYCMRLAATELGLEILPLPQEWWDFRFERPVWEQFAPLREADVLPSQRLIAVDKCAMQTVLDGQLPKQMQENVDDVNLRVKRAFDMLIKAGLESFVGSQTKTVPGHTLEVA